MTSFLARAAAVGVLSLVGGCATYPYSTAFSSCDSAAGACYRGCEDYEGTSQYESCHADCEYSADSCFDRAYEPYRYNSYGYGYPPTWRGRYGYWYPDSGYSFSFGYYDYGGGYYDRRRHHRYRHRRDDGQSGSGSTPPPPPASSPPPRSDAPPAGSGRDYPRRAVPRTGEVGEQPPRVNRTPPASPPPSPPPAATQSQPPSPQASPPPSQGGTGRSQPRRETSRDRPDRDVD